MPFSPTNVIQNEISTSISKHKHTKLSGAGGQAKLGDVGIQHSAFAQHHTHASRRETHLFTSRKCLSAARGRQIAADAGPASTEQKHVCWEEASLKLFVNVRLSHSCLTSEQPRAFV